MYEYITGTISELTPTAAVIEAGGVGYFINISLQTQAKIANLKKAKLLVHTYVLQMEAPVLYGFATAGERDLFRLLISISGIGANTARVMLSTYSTEEMVGLIATGNVAAIKQTKGIGIKTAERVVLELKDKVLKVMAGVEIEGDSSAVYDGGETISQACEALTVLGFTKATTEKVVKKLFAKNPTLSVEDLIKESLGVL